MISTIKRNINKRIALSGYNGFIFDFDGVIADTEPLKELAYFQTIKKLYRIEIETCDKSWIGKSEKDVVNHFNEAYHLNIASDKYAEVIEIKRQIYHQIITDYSIDLIKGIQVFLHELQRQKKRIAIASMSTANEINTILQRKQLDSFINFIISKDDVAEPKPNPRIYSKAIEILKLDKSVCVVFEDSKSGLTAATNAGLETILVKHAYNKDIFNDNGFEISDFSEITVC